MMVHRRIRALERRLAAQLMGAEESASRLLIGKLWNTGQSPLE